MASSQKKLDIDSLTVNHIYTRGVNNENIPLEFDFETLA